MLEALKEAECLARGEITSACVLVKKGKIMLRCNAREERSGLLYYGSIAIERGKVNASSACGYNAFCD